MDTVQPSREEAELRTLMAERKKASIEGDVDKIGRSMADDYLQTDIYGYRQDKTAWLNEYFKPLAELMNIGEFHWETYDQKDVQVRFHGDCAVVIGRLEAKGVGARPGPIHSWIADPNSSFGGTACFTHVYIRSGGRWLLMALHNAVALPREEK